MIFKILFALATLGVFWTISIKNPTLASEHNLIDQLPKNKFKVPVLFNHSEHQNTLMNSIYRMNPQRNAKSDMMIQFPVKYRKLFDSLNGGIHGASKSSPAIDETGIYIGSDLGWMTAIDHQGNLKWRFKVKDSKNGIHSTALLNSTEVIFGAYNGRLYSLDKVNGSVNWVVNLGDVIGSSPVQDKKGDIYISVEKNIPADGYLVKMDSKGQILWRSEFAGEQAHSSPALSVEEDVVLYGSNNGFLNALNSTTGDTLWRYQVNGPIKSTPVIVGKKVIFTYRGEGGLAVLNIKDGQLLWQMDIGPEGAHGSPVVIPEEDAVFIISSTGTLFSVALSSGKLKWKKNISSRPYKMSPSAFKAVSDPQPKWSIVTFCDKYKLCFFSIPEGKLHQKVPIKSILSGEVALFKERIYFSLDYPGDVGVIESSITTREHL